ncbi:MAG: hypothetical protein HOP15_01425, partial [Planctomycetes bacterium]|nr:hypothetical protein [Planctomycetota bacterium]
MKRLPTIRAHAFPARGPETEPSFALAAWLALFLVLARASVLFALEFAHHGDLGLAGLRLANAFLPLAVAGAGIALAAALGAWGLGLGSGRVLRGLVPLVLAAVMFAFLWGRLDDDPSRRHGRQGERDLPERRVEGDAARR